MGSKVELFEQIRRDRELLGFSQRALIAKYRVHRRTVLQALESAVPPPRKRPERRPVPKLGGYCELIDEWLIADQFAPRKQRHTAKRGAGSSMSMESRSRSRRSVITSASAAVNSG